MDQCGTMRNSERTSRILIESRRIGTTCLADSVLLSCDMLRHTWLQGSSSRNCFYISEISEPGNELFGLWLQFAHSDTFYKTCLGSNSFVSAQALMYESNWLLLLEAGLLLCGVGLEVFYLWRCCCFRNSV